MDAGSRPSRSGRTARGAERQPGARPRTRPSWADVGLAVHVLSGRGEDHGDGSQGHADGRIERTTVRRRAPLELRCVRVARTNAAVRTERLRRDASRAVRVRREAHGGELHDRGTQQRLHPIRCTCRDARVGRGLSNTDGRVRRDAHAGRLVRAPVGTRAHERRSRTPRAPWNRRAARRPARPRRRPPRSRHERRTLATACRRCRSWPSTSMAGTGSSASRRS